MRRLKIGIAADHAGFELKEQIKTKLKMRRVEVVDLGAFDATPSDYPDFAATLGAAVMARRIERGILICGSGVGASVAANKIAGIRAGLCHDCYSARQGVEHDDINVLVLGSRVIGSALAETVVTEFLDAKFSNEERHRRRLKKVQELERAFEPDRS